MPLNPQTVAAIVLAKTAGWLLKTFKLGSGSALPGKIALKVAPQLFKHLTQQVPLRIVVTGTNGKSTTSGLLVSLLKENGHTVVHNHLGANMLNGLLGALITSSNITGNINATCGVFEVDEATLPNVAPSLQQHFTVVTNLFRDQLDRYGELSTTANLIVKGITSGQVILNADDPMVAAMAKQLENTDALFYSLSSNSSVHPSTIDLLQRVPIPKEVTDCPVCKAPLDYTETTYGHLGHYQCSACDFIHPKAQWSVIHCKPNVQEPTQQTLTLKEAGHDGMVALNSQLSGLFNAYNVLAATSVFCASQHLLLDQASTLLQHGLTNYQNLFGRSQVLTIDEKQVATYLIKNPIGAGEVLSALTQAQYENTPTMLIAINDNDADGRDISWLWDAPFELLSMWQKSTGANIVVAGQRAADMAVRLKYTNVTATSILGNPTQAYKTCMQQLSAGHSLIILPTYTALLELSQHLNTR